MYRRTAVLWTLAILTFGVGDVTTTYVGLNTPGVVEANPSLTAFVQMFGLLGMIGMKVSLMAVCFLWYVALGDHPSDIGVPIGLSIVGITVTVWNLYILSVAF